MASLNRVELIGNLGADPELRSLNSGGQVVNLRVACTEKWKGKDGQQQERTEWVSVVIFNEPLGKIAAQYLRKGSKVYLSGKLQTRKWQDQSGNDRYSTEVVLQPYHGELILLYSKGGELEAEPARGGGGGSAYDAELDDDVPFASCDPRRDNYRPHRV